MKIQLKNVHFEYLDGNAVFDNLSLSLEIDQQNPNKLVGIIGPSGTGKTTLISIVGGQLNPQSGKVLINDQDIYQLFDTQKRQLIAIQLQTSTAIRGSVRKNLTFGISIIDEENGEQKQLFETITDNNYLIEILKSVGLWKIFEKKDGLETKIGEGGVNLSGGQRQRLNFASLYLRSLYFKPQVILIDEPTSSLDEISEKAITKMITEISKNALTLVVAHRLNTLNSAHLLIDTSLIKISSEVVGYTRDELKEVSEYYQMLSAGKTDLEEVED